MANGHGGKRLGAGRKPKTRRQRWLGGKAGHRGLSLVAPAPPTAAAVEEAAEHPSIERPGVLSASESVYWDIWAPTAMARGTLHVGTVPGFVLLCQWARKADVFWACIEERGLEQEKVTIDGAGQEHREYKPNGLLARWSDAMKRVEHLQARYGLAADGKVATEAAKGDDEENQLAKLLAIQ